MKCPFCQGVEIKVVDSRSSDDNTTIKRRRECLHCKERFTTFERFERENMYVKKRDGSLENLSPNKIRQGLIRSLEKRPITASEIEALCEKILSKLYHCEQSAIESKTIGLFILEELKKVDSVAYIRFASVYNEFNSINEFMNIIEQMKEENDERCNH